MSATRQYSNWLEYDVWDGLLHTAGNAFVQLSRLEVYPCSPAAWSGSFRRDAWTNPEYGLCEHVEESLSEPAHRKWMWVGPGKTLRCVSTGTTAQGAAGVLTVSALQYKCLSLVFLLVWKAGRCYCLKGGRKKTSPWLHSRRFRKQKNTPLCYSNTYTRTLKCLAHSDFYKMWSRPMHPEMWQD